MPEYRMLKGSPQYKFNKSRAYIQVFGGGYGNGKTAALCIKAIELLYAYPGVTGLLGRATYPKLRDSLQAEFFKWFPSDDIARAPTDRDNTLYMKNGSICRFRYIQQQGKQGADGTTTSNLLSTTIGFAGIDQVEDPEITQKDMLDLLGRLRLSVPYIGDDPTMPRRGPHWLMLTANPSPNWVYTELVKPYHIWKETGVKVPELMRHPDTNEPIIEIIEGPTSSNPSLDKNYLDLLRSSYSGNYKKRFFDGEWGAYEGLVYPQFDRTVHMIPQADMLKILHKPQYGRFVKYQGYQAFDLGLAVPSCYLIGFVDERGRVFIIDGFYEPTPNYDKAVEKIVALQDLYKGVIDISPDRFFADPQLFKKTQVSRRGRIGESVAQVLDNEYGLEINPGANEIKSGILKVSSYLDSRPGMHYSNNGDDGPMMYIADHLKFIEDEITAYFWTTNTQGQRQDQPADRNDHAMDDLKYLLTELPEASEIVDVLARDIPDWLRWCEHD